MGWVHPWVGLGWVQTLKYKSSCMIFFVSYATSCSPHQTCKVRYNTITTEEFNVDSKAEYSTLSSTRRENKKAVLSQGIRAMPL